MRDLAQGRRGFLRGLATLPLIGGGITILGAPTKAAVPVTQSLKETYLAWLDHESEMLSFEIKRDLRYDFGSFAPFGPKWQWHRPRQANGQPFDGFSKCQPHQMPSSRAAVVLSAVGCYEVFRPGEYTLDERARKFARIFDLGDPKELAAEWRKGGLGQTARENGRRS